MKIYTFSQNDKSPERLKSVLKTHPEIQFVSLLAVDFGNNHTDEKIPVSSIVDDLEHFLSHGIQTDGSSNHLPIITTINNAKVDIIPDIDAQWVVDYNPQNPEVGTLLIPSFLMHDGKYVCSRSVLKNAVKSFKKRFLELIQRQGHILKDLPYDIKPEDVDDIVITLATELEFWVKTPDTKTEIEKLSVSQSLKEQYWKKTKGVVRLALENTLIKMAQYDLEPEMGHKEVGGVSPKLAGMNVHSHVMEQLEIDWKYDTAMRACDKELYVKDIVSDVFESCGLSVNFQAKPVDGVAGSGEHHHIGFALKLKNGKRVNLITPKDETSHFMTRIGYGALMGILQNYQAINPFVSTNSDAFRRLKPGFEAPVCTVASLGHSKDIPSRNRTVLIALVREMGAPHTPRFELRSPTASSNSYLLTAAMLQSAIHGIEAVANSGLSHDEIEESFNKKTGEEHFYLSKDREFRTEEDVFTVYDETHRNNLYGKPPATLYENLSQFDTFGHEVLTTDEVFTELIIESYKEYMRSEWVAELKGRIIPSNRSTIRRLKRLSDDLENDKDIENWQKVTKLQEMLMKDNINEDCLFTKLIKALDKGDYDTASSLEVQMSKLMNSLTECYNKYRINMLY